jgi:formate hydrogenlyase subunit 3/multisubunit Na+/H+ antiporter MnhD subunit
MGLDIRWPIGVIFSIYGVIMLVYGKLADASIFQEKSLGINIDLWWGLVMLAFGVLMGALAFRASRRSEP